MHQALVVENNAKDERRQLRVHANINASTNVIKLEFSSISPTQPIPTSHADCTIEFEGSQSWLKRWKRDSYLIQDRITSLEKKASSGTINKITTGLAYRLFSSLMDYTPEYQRMNLVLFDATHFEAVATVSLDDHGSDSAFHFSPYWIDSLLHISGFVLNGNDTVDHREAVYIAHGWDTLRIVTPLDSRRTYQSYVRMHPEGTKMMAGNVWILCDGGVVGLVENIQFRRIPRKALDVVLRSAGGKPSLPKKPDLGVSPMEAKMTGIQQRKTERGSESSPDRQAALTIIASELGITENEISLSDRLAHLGFDSLMSLTLASKLFEQLGIDVSSTRITEVDTIGELLALISGGVNHSNIRHTEQQNVAVSNITSSWSSSEYSGFDILTLGSTYNDWTDIVQCIIIEETGVSPEDFSPAMDLTELGVDSLMTLVILEKLREAGLDLPNDVFEKHRTMNAVLDSLKSDKEVALPDLLPIKQEIKPLTHGKTYEAGLILIQRRKIPNSRQILFLFPAAVGSPGQCAPYDHLSPEFDVYGLISPYMTDPSGYTCFATVAHKYVDTIRKHQPQGPYHLGGNSIGGIHAYEAARTMVELGLEGKSLIMIDSPCPLVIAPMHTELITYLLAIEAQKSPRIDADEHSGAGTMHRLKHVQTLAKYTPLPMPSSVVAPRTLPIWAKDALRDDELDADPPFRYTRSDPTSIEAFMLDERTDFSSNGWGTLIPEAKIEITAIAGAHSNIDRLPHRTGLCKAIQHFLADFHTLTPKHERCKQYCLPDPMQSGH